MSNLIGWFYWINIRIEKRLQRCRRSKVARIWSVHQKKREDMTSALQKKRPDTRSGLLNSLFDSNLLAFAQNIEGEACRFEFSRKFFGLGGQMLVHCHRRIFDEWLLQ